MREHKSLAEWLEGQGNPKYATAEGDYGLMVLAVESKDTLNPGITIYNYEERALPNGSPYFWVSAGWGVRKEYLPALKKFLDTETTENFFNLEEKNTDKITLDEALAKRNEVRALRRSFKVNDETPIGILGAEYDWGFWDAVVTIMKNCGMKELDAKAVQ